MCLGKKAGIACLAVIAVVMGIIGVSSKLPADDGRNGGVGNEDDYRYIINQDGTAKIVGYLKEEREVRIPSELGGHPVKVIGRKAFASKLSTVSVQIPATVKEIKREAFLRSGIKEIRLPEGVLKVGNEAFGYCQELESIYISQSVEKIDGSIADGSGRLREIEVDSQNAVYASVDGALYNKDVTEVLEMPEGKDLSGFHFPDSAVCIGEHAFSGSSFTEFVVPDQITALKHGAFAYCENLEKAVIGKGVEDIVDYAFFECGNLCEVMVNGKLKTIGKQAFLGCYNLVKINIPDGVAEIGDMAFYNCVGLKNIIIPKSVVKIGNKAIGCCEDCDENIPGVFITAYKGTAAHRCAKGGSMAFRDIETGEAIRYDLRLVPMEKIKKLAAGKGKITLSYKEAEEAVYQVAVKEAGASSWKRYQQSEPSAVIKGLKSGKQYRVKVRAVREIEGKQYSGYWSRVKKITVR